MAEETVVAESSAAAAAPETKFTQFDGWDEDGTPVVSKKEETPNADNADSATADTSKETKTPKDGTEDAADSAAKKTQEKKNRTEARIKELLARAEKAEKDLEEARKPKETKPAESSTAKSEQKPANDPATRTKPTFGDKGADGKPKYGSYEDFVEDLADWKAEQRIAAQQREAQTAQMFEKVRQQLTEARERYPDYDQVAKPVHQELMKPDISREVFAVINDSPVLADLLYTIGGTEDSKADFLDACRTNPGKALRVALLMEQEIVKELGKGKAAAKSGEGKKAGEGDGKAPPATEAVKPRAPKPPAEVGGRGAPGEDSLIEAAKRNDFRSFEAEQTRRAMASRR